jgi:hypothetical protein
MTSHQVGYHLKSKNYKHLEVFCSPKNSPKNTAIWVSVKMSGKELGHEQIAVYSGANYLCTSAGGIRYIGAGSLPQNGHSRADFLSLEKEIPGYGYIESFNGKMRDELLNREIFTPLEEAKGLIEQWRREYNQVRPHSALGYQPPAPETILTMATR